MVYKNDNGKLVNTLDIACPPYDLVLRQKAIIGLVRNQDPELMDYQDIRRAMDILEDMLPTDKQTEVYLTPESKIRILSNKKSS